jgi:hypothetical protein
MTKFLAIISWILGALGVAIMVVTYIDAARIGVWVDEHQPSSFPDSVPEFVIAFLGFIVVVLAVIIGARALRLREELQRPTRETSSNQPVRSTDE